MSTIRIEFKFGESGLIFATSPDLKGLLVSERTFAELEKSIPHAIAALREAGAFDPKNPVPL